MEILSGLKELLPTVPSRTLLGGHSRIFSGVLPRHLPGDSPISEASTRLLPRDSLRVLRSFLEICNVPTYALYFC